MPVPAQTAEKTRVLMHEDWAIVLLGFLIIGVLVSGLTIPVPRFSWTTTSDLLHVLRPENLAFAGAQFGFLYVFAIGASWLTTGRITNTLVVFPAIALLTLIALILAGNATVKSLNLEAVIFSLGTGLIVSNVFNLPEWFRKSLTAEMFVKIGLVLLGTSVIFSDILKAGGLGLVQALLVVVAVWYFAYWLCRKLRIDDDLTMMIASSVSICGVSAAIATAGAIHGDTRKLSYVISLVLITAIPMMIIMPWAAGALDLPEAVTGAWIGGSIDTTGAVVASGTLVGDTALKISTIVKFSQNVLLGVAAFAISVYWTYTGRGDQAGVSEKPTLAVIWRRFPKFVLGFVASSLLFSFVLSAETITDVKESLKSIQTMWFVLAFTSIGLETRFSDLFNAQGKRPLIAFLTAQFFNILFTLVIAYLLFR